jgi:protein-S-isoprenylcysteine O-methyltransferase Ste14
MTAGGWAFLVGSWAVILALFIFCLVRTLRADSEEGRDA